MIPTLTQCLVELLVDGGKHMTVSSQSDIDGGVAHAFHDCPGVGTLGDKERGVGMPEIVEPRATREPGSDDGRLEVPGIPI